MTPIDVPTYPLWLLVLCVLGALTTGMVAGWTFYAALRADDRRTAPLVARATLDRALADLTREQQTVERLTRRLDDVRGNLTRTQRERDAWQRHALATLATLTTPTDA